MGHDWFEILVNSIKLAVIFLMMVQMVPILVWAERRGSAFIQNRFGPNRVGPLGLIQLLADAAKFLQKENFVPENGIKFLYYAAPVFALIPGAVAFSAIPLSVPIKVDAFNFDIDFLSIHKVLGPYTIPMQGYEIGVGIVFILAISSLAAYAILMAGYGSGNKYSLLGALRASAQMISYELALSLAVVGVILLYGTFNLQEMVAAQQGPLSFRFLGQLVTLPVHNWGIFYQPLGAILFFAATFAEANRLPFDLAEGEAELVAGFHVEYGGFKMLMFFIGEYGHMMIASGLMVVFYFGGYDTGFWSLSEIQQWAAALAPTATKASILVSLVCFLSFFIKLVVFLWLFIQVRWTLPRFRYDQLMDLGWKTMLPWALFNTILTAVLLFAAPGKV